MEVTCTSTEFSGRENEVEFLYKILTQRQSFEPGFKKPSYDQHVMYLNDWIEKYKAIMMISIDGTFVSTFYMSHNNELGVYHDTTLNRKSLLHVAREWKTILYEYLQSNNYPEFWTQAFRYNKTAINSTKSLHKNHLQGEYELKIIQAGEIQKHVFSNK